MYADKEQSTWQIHCQGFTFANAILCELDYQILNILIVLIVLVFWYSDVARDQKFDICRLVLEKEGQYA